MGGFDTGWTGYPPLSAASAAGIQMFFLGVSLSSFSSILSALNILVSVTRLRAKGIDAFPHAHFSSGCHRHFRHQHDRHTVDRPGFQMSICWSV